MPKMERILVPVDFSEPSAQAARYAKSLAEHFDSKLSLLHVMPPFEFEFSLVQPASQRQAEFVRARNQTVRQALENFPGESWNGLPVSRELREGEASEEIVRLAHDGGYDLIVMPTRGANALRRWLFIGSVTMNVLGAAECPVLTGVHGLQGSPELFRRLLCAIDLGPQSERVLCWAWGLAQTFEAPLTVVHAVPGAGEAAADFFDESWRMTLATRLRDRIGQLLEGAGAQADIVIEPGNPRQVVASVAQRLDAGLVVLGRGHAGDLVGRLRANAYEIIRMAPCPAISV